MTDRYAQVAVLNGSPQHGTFTYTVPEGLLVRRGMSVVVPWRTRRAIGIILEVASRSQVDEPRQIERILDPLPLLTQRQLELADWIASHYLAPIAACVTLFLPPGTPTRPRASGSTFRPIVPSIRRTPKRLELDITRDRLRAVVADWPRSKKSRPATLLSRLADGHLSEAEAARELGGRRALDTWLGATAMASREGGQVRLAVDPDEARVAADALRRTASERRQLSVLRLLESGELDEAEARRRSGATVSDIEFLVKAGHLRRFRQSMEAALPAPAEALPLTDEQQVAADAVIRSIAAPEGETFLLHGVTGSGKTEVYLAATQRALAAGGGVIVLVPEIALAPQTISQFEARFPGQVAVRHSGLSRSEAREQWRQVHAGEKRILIGARSALFGPVRDLALVVVDEEHEWTYKQQDPQPRYHAAAVAHEMSHSWGVTTLFGSATPDVVSMARARSGQDRLLHLRDRVQSDALAAIPIPQPTVDVVDMREELAAGVRSVFSRELDTAISDALSRDEQVLLFLNRRGMSALVCRACGEAVECGRCSVAMTLHRPGPFLQCHECGERQSTPARCPSCFDERVGAMSFGTAQLEAEVRRRWGDVPITRWDRDTTSASGSHEALLREFAAGRSRVLVGTQMIAKGLDLPRVTVAGVVNADLSLRESDYRGPERTFQLLSQVAGRAGRGALGGRVIVQTYSPDHFAVAAAAAHDYDAFYGPEMRMRAELDYPPFGRLARLTVARSTIDEADAEAARVVRELTSLRDRTVGAVADVIGPAPANPARRRSQWRRQILLKGDDPVALLSQLELGRGWSVDIDPVG
ncbi:MAG: primosomal protein N' [Chloroflexota bacterium]|nr:primosomal protein N' [Chloroflexota bacterium]